MKTPTYSYQRLLQHIRSIGLPEVNLLARLILKEKDLYTNTEYEDVYKVLVERTLELSKPDSKDRNE